MYRLSRSIAVDSVVAAVAEEQGALASLAVSGEPDGRYEVAYGNIVEKPPMGAFEAWTASVLFGLLQRSDNVRARGFTVSELMFLLDPVKKLERRPDLAFV